MDALAQTKACSSSEANPVRWDLIFLLYLASIITTSMSFGCSHDGQYDNIMFTLAFAHFGFETVLSCYLLHPMRWAYRLSILSVCVCAFQALLIWFVSDDLKFLMFAYNFPASDSLSILSSVVAVLSANMPQRWKMLPIAVSLHMIGALIKLSVLPREMFARNLVPQHGAAWFWIAAVLIPQIYVGRDVIRGHCNELGEVRYDKAKSAGAAAFRMWAVPMISHIVIPATVITMGVFKTTELETGNYFASGIWKELILDLGLPICSFAIVAILYALATKDQNTKQH